MVSGYQSHFVITTKDGQPIDQLDTYAEFNELVISQESQAVAVYLVKLSGDIKDKERMMKAWKSRFDRGRRDRGERKEKEGREGRKGKGKENRKKREGKETERPLVETK
eukprot:TRINITY_DN4593_c0_g1_i2.p1 TRINITY_DN4593_c0_g1~~TRINITY_DN4593_c0_g1_i2.p1  ORF type:complete len:109 (+),score=28.23 TRINITY_DN4593_c0_g1_i2:60-386(+)